MICLLIAATGFEISPFTKFYGDINSELSPNVTIDVLATGIGLTACTYSITKQLQIRKPDIIIQAGISGCFDKSIPLGSVVAVKQDRIADLGVTEKNKIKTVFDLELVSPNQFPFSKGWLVNKNEALKKLRLKKVTAISVNEITTSKNKIRIYQENFDPVVESMEGAALHYVCLMEKIPFLQIRALSNYIGERNKKKWDMKNSIANLNAELIKIVKTLNS